jgi:hypothetical protein
MNTVVQ